MQMISVGGVNLRYRIIYGRILAEFMREQGHV